MITFRGLSAAIRVDDKDLLHFQPDYDEETKKVTCWIPSEAGKEYTVWWKQDGIKMDTAGFIYIDGNEKRAAGRFLSPGNETLVSAAAWSATEERPFIFADIDVTGKRTRQIWPIRLIDEFTR